MRDDPTFETRFANALARYADLAPAMDDTAIARGAIADDRTGSGALSDRLRRWVERMGMGRPAVRAAYVLLLLSLLLIVVLAALAVGAFQTEPLLPLARNGVIVFTVQGNNHQAAGTHLINPDGSGDHGIESGRCPTYSADGSVLAAVSYEGAASLVVERADGTPARTILLVDEPPTSVAYALSPDGTRVAWFKELADSVELWVAPLDGGAPDRILSGDASSNYASPVWSPDGRRLAFAAFVSDPSTGVHVRSAIDVIDADGADLRRLTTRPALLDDGMSWSPDGQTIAYVGLPDGQPASSPGIDPAPSAYPPRDIFVIGADGTGDREITHTPDTESQPEWSPDGEILAYKSSADGAVHRLTTVHMEGSMPSGEPVLGPESEWFVWSPDGAALLWVEVSSSDSATFRSVLRSIDRELRQPPVTLQSVDGRVVCKPSWQRLEP